MTKIYPLYCIDLLSFHCNILDLLLPLLKSYHWDHKAYIIKLKISCISSNLSTPENLLRWRVRIVQVVSLQSSLPILMPPKIPQSIYFPIPLALECSGRSDGNVQINNYLHPQLRMLGSWQEKSVCVFILLFFSNHVNKTVRKRKVLSLF